MAQEPSTEFRGRGLFLCELGCIFSRLLLSTAQYLVLHIRCEKAIRRLPRNRPASRRARGSQTQRSQDAEAIPPETRSQPVNSCRSRLALYSSQLRQHNPLL